MDDVRVKLWIVTVLSIVFGVFASILSQNFVWVAIGFGIGVILHLTYNMVVGSASLPWVIGNFGGIVAIIAMAVSIGLSSLLWAAGAVIILVACLVIAWLVNLCL